MKEYTVKAGENIYDIAMKLYGCIEGVFSLMAMNQDAVSETGLSLYDTLRAGTVLRYAENSSTNKDVVNWLDKNGIRVRNGDKDFFHCDMGRYMSACVRQHNLYILKKSLYLWPSIAGYKLGDTGEEVVAAFLDHINNNCVWADAVSESDIPSFIDGDYSMMARLSVPERIDIPVLMVKQEGVFSQLSYQIGKHGIVAIDWGDDTIPDVFLAAGIQTTSAHSYADDGQHTICLYGSSSFDVLDLRGIGGTYYPLREIAVSGNFYSDMINEKINKLIIRQGNGQDNQ